MSGLDNLITNYRINYLPHINNYSIEYYSSFSKEIYNKAKNIAILKYIKLK